MTARFRTAPQWAKRTLAAGSAVAYAVFVLMGLIGLTWPHNDMRTLEFAGARGAGLILTVSAGMCLASFLLRGPNGGARWRWELRGAWPAGVALGVYALVVLSYDPLSARGLLVLALMALSLGAFLRGVSLLSFESETRAAKEAAEGE